MEKTAKLFIRTIVLWSIIGGTFVATACKNPTDSGDSALTGTVSISGTAIVGQTLTVNISNLKGSGTISYQWKRGTATIGTNNTYTVQTTDVGMQITVTITRSGNSGSVTSAATVVVIGQNLPALTGTVSINGTAEVGKTLAVNTASLGGTGTISYQWKRGTTNIGTNSSTYSIQTADVGGVITVTVSRSNNSGSITSAATAAITDPSLPSLTGTVSISGTAQEGQTLTANTASLGGSGTIFYQWKRGTTNVGTNSASYTVQAADAGSTITVTVTRSGNSGSVTSEATAAVTDSNLPALTGTVSISGTAEVGKTLTANTANLGGTGTISYQWMRGATNIGANSSSYTVQAADVGGVITVTVSRLGNSGSVTSAATADVSLPALTGTVSISGIAEAGKTLTANIGSLGGTGTISYQWKRGTTDIGTNNNTYTVQAADGGGFITVTVSRSGNSGSITSATVGPIAIPTGTATLSISFTQFTDIAPSITGPTLYRVSDGGPTSAILTVDNPDQYDTISWRVDNTAETGTDSSFALSTANAAYNLIGEHFVTVMVMKNGTPYNKTVSFKIEY